MRFIHYFWKYLDYFLDGFSSRLCFGCKIKYSDRSNKFYCKDCYKKLDLNFEDTKKNLAYKMIELDEFFEGEPFHYPRIHFMTEYNDLTKSLMREFKYRKPHYLSFWVNELETFIRNNIDFLFSAIDPSLIKFYDKDKLEEASLKIYLSFMPMHHNQKKRRGFNQAELLAVNIDLEGLTDFIYQFNDGLKKVTNLKLEFLPDLFIRTKDTKKLFDKNRLERLEILKSCFALNPEYKLEAGALLIVLDDITTTGASFMSIYKELLSQNTDVDILFLALSGKN